MMISVNLRPGKKRGKSGPSLAVSMDRIKGLGSAIKDPLRLVAVLTWVGVAAFLGLTFMNTSSNLSELEPRLVQAGAVSLAVAFALVGWSASLGSPARFVLFVGAGLIALGSGLFTPSVSSYVSRCADPASQGVTLGTLQSVSALARVFGPAGGGFLYENVGKAAPYFLGSVGMVVAAALALGLDQLCLSPRRGQRIDPCNPPEGSHFTREQLDRDIPARPPPSRGRP